MRLMGIGDEAGSHLQSQIDATLKLGWNLIELRNVEVQGFEKANIHDLPDQAFDLVESTLKDAGVGVHCFGSTVMNWSKRVDDPFERTLQEVARCISRMQRLGTRFVRIMSFKPGEQEVRIPRSVFRAVSDVTRRFLDAGIQPLHENCMNHGGMSLGHALELMEQCPGLLWLFDTGNPVFNPDRSTPLPWSMQDPWEFWLAIRDRVAHIHIKDARWNSSRNDADYTWPGEGDGQVKKILKDAINRGYLGGVSIEPHMVSVFHSLATFETGDDSFMTSNFIEYGNRLKTLISTCSLT